MVAKECFIGKYWNYKSSWYGPPQGYVPWEAGLHAMMPSHKHVIEYLGQTVNTRLKMARIYTAFAELGDLHDLFENHQSLYHHGAYDAYEEDRHLQQHTPNYIPNLAVLCLSEAMAASVCLMAHGLLPDDQGQWPADGGDGDAPDNPWQHDFVHRDIKPGNYFLSGPVPKDSKVWPGLPTAVIGDFGNAIDKRDPVYALDPDLMRSGGTMGWMAPEQDGYPPHPHPVTSATNVYQIGLLMCALMTLHVPQFQPRSSDTNEDADQLFPEPDDTIYSANLISFAKSCIRMEPQDRPSPKELYMAIRRIAMEYPSGGTHAVPMRE